MKRGGGKLGDRPQRLLPVSQDEDSGKKQNGS
jgi:hypothetical protein